MRPTVRHHYRGTKIALWLDLIPKLHQSDSLEPKFHLLNNYDNSSTFEEEGTRQLDMDVIFPPPPIPPVSPPPKTARSSSTREPTTTLASTTASTTASTSTTSTPTTPRQRLRTPRPNISRKHNYPSTTPVTNATTLAPQTGAMSGKDNTLSLSVTIAVGCSLLFLNILIFAGVYYQKDRMRMEMKVRQRELEKEKATAVHDSDLPKSSSGPDTDTNSSTMATPPVPPCIARHQVQPQVTTLPKHPIPVLPPHAPYPPRHSGSLGRQPVSLHGLGVQGLKHDTHPDSANPRYISTLSPRHSKSSTLERDSKTQLRHSPSADSGTDVNNHPGNPVTMV